MEAQDIPTIGRRLAPNRAVLQRLVDLVRDTLLALAELRQRGVIVQMALLSLVCWLLIYASGYALLRGAGLRLSFADAVFAYGFPTLASLTPVYMLGGFGVYEGSLGVGLGMVGVSTNLALAAGLLLHVAELFFVVVSALSAPFFGARRKPAAMDGVN